MDAVKKAMNEFLAAGVVVGQTLEQVGRAKAERDKINAEKDVYYKRFDKEGSAGAGREQAMDADPVWQKLHTAVMAAFRYVTTLEEGFKKGMAVREKIRGVLRTQLNEFKTMVDAKDHKETNPLKKKSVGPARAFIKEVEGIL
jgi:hypothetical protein